MTTELKNRAAQSTPLPSMPWRDRLGQGVANLLGTRFDHLLDGISDGQLIVTWPDGHVTRHGARTDEPYGNASIELHNWQPLKHMVRSGEVGFAESYLRGDWSSDDLVSLFTLTMRNEEAIAQALSGGRWSRFLNLFNHWGNRNSVRGSRRNIAYHYDLGNAFYSLWLDETMSYSSGMFDEADERSLPDAQRAKLDRVVTHLEPASGARVLEIGCGWGALGRRLAEAGCHVEGISLSREQLAWASENNTVQADNSHTGSTAFEYRDYRTVQGTYDHIVSIEMFEAVGEQYWTVYFEKLAALLEQDGTAVLQVITILEERFEVYRSHPDFIQRYIFPGGMLPTKTRLSELAAAAGFEVEARDWFGPGYARTLARWRDRFEACSREVAALGFDDRFVRMWRYYLSYCEAGFRHGSTDVGMLKLRRIAR